MNAHSQISVAVLIAVFFLTGAPLGCSEDGKEVAQEAGKQTGKEPSADELLFAGLIVNVDVEGRQIELAGNVLLAVTATSRLFDRAGNPVALEAFAEIATEEPAEEFKSMTIAYYKASVYAEGKLVIEWLSLAGPIVE